MDFNTAVDRLTACIAQADIAKAAGVSAQSIRQARLDPTNPGYRVPPEGWRKAVASLARQRARELTALADAVARG
jgi:hypothetical protein